MKVRMLGWEAKGLRCPDAKVRFDAGDQFPKVTLIQMPNGTGKTTTLTLLKAALTGSAEKWKADYVMEFAPKEGGTGDGNFLIRLLVDEKPLIIELKLSFLDGSVSYRTTSPAAGGVKEGWHPPEDARRFLSEKFVGLFVFDGELASRMLDPAEQGADGAIDALCQLDLLDHVGTAAELSWERSTKDKQGAKTESGLAVTKNKEKQLHDRRNKLKQHLKEAKERLTLVANALAGQDKDLAAKLTEDEKNRAILEKLRLEEQAGEAALDKANSAVMSLMRQPHKLATPFASALVALKLNLDRVKLPDATSRQFFIELADEPNCICGRPIGPSEKLRIHEKSKDYLGEDISGILNSLKQDVGLLVASTDSEESRLPEAMIQLASVVKSYQEVRTRRLSLHEKLVAEAGDEAKRLRDQVVKLKKEKDELEAIIKEMARAPIASDDDKTYCILWFERELDKVRKKISEITGTVDLRKRTDVIKELVSKAKLRAREHLREVLVSECNRRLESILAASPVRIHSIQNSIVLDGQREASIGQTLAVGYTFLTAVLGRGAHQFPLVVDSPAGPLDDRVRAEIGAMIPKLCEQFVAFTITTERHHFVPALSESAEGSVRYLTLFRRTVASSKLKTALPTHGVHESENAVLVEGKKYFDEFSFATEAELEPKE
jgi:DNA sulfur modification protein DndD